MSGFNVIKLTGDFAHLFAIMFLLFSIWIKKSSHGVSAKSQVLFLMVSLSRYLDVFTTFTSYCNTSLKVSYIVIHLLTCFLILIAYKRTYQKDEDTVRSEIAVFGCFVISIFNTYDLGPMGIMWTFSQSLEALSLIPQFFLIFNTKKISCNVLIYLAAMGTSSVFHSINWIYQHYIEEDTDTLANISSLTFVSLFLFIFYSSVLFCRGIEIEKDPERNFMTRNIFLISDTKMTPETFIEKDGLITDK